MNLREQLLSQLIIDPSGCVLWHGRTDRDGYGRLRYEGRDQLVHRLTWLVLEGPIPDGFDIDHVQDRGCRHRHCAGIAHLEPVTRAVNNQRKGAGLTHCRNGHPYDEVNTHLDTRGWRTCRACNREAARRYKARKRESP